MHTLFPGHRHVDNHWQEVISTVKYYHCERDIGSTLITYLIFSLPWWNGTCYGWLWRVQLGMLSSVTIRKLTWAGCSGCSSAYWFMGWSPGNRMLSRQLGKSCFSLCSKKAFHNQGPCEWYSSETSAQCAQLVKHVLAVGLNKGSIRQTERGKGGDEMSFSAGTVTLIVLASHSPGRLSQMPAWLAGRGEQVSLA